jgi:hypothetical protein
MGKSLSFYKEKFGGILSGLLCFCIVICSQPSYANWKGFINEFPTIGMCAFGFLLTFLSIILQGNSETIIWMKSNDVLFKRFIDFNKRVVSLSILLVLYSYLISFFNFQLVFDFLSLPAKIIESLKYFSIAIFFGGIIWFVYDIFFFMKIFYLLIKK